MRRPIVRDINQRRRVPGSLVINWVNFVDPRELKPVCWYDASDTATITESGGSVSQWNDKSGNGYHVTQAVGANQPTTGSNTINGLNVLTFDGSNDRLSNTSVPALSSPHTYVIVAKENSGITAVKALLNSGSTGGTVFALFLSSTSPSRQTNVFSGSTVGGQILTATNTNIIYAKAQGATSEFGLNGVYVTANMGTFTRASALRIGINSVDNGEFFAGQIAEAFYFNSALSNIERDLLFNYLSRKWGAP